MKKLFKDKRIIVVILVIIAVFLLIDFNQRMVLLTRLRGQEKQLTERYAALEDTREALETQIAFANSDEAVEQWAREEASMIREGDIPIIILPSSDTISTEPLIQPPTVDEVQRWQIWLELFFGQ